MNVVVVPVKAPSLAKSRLGAVLPGAERERLARRLADHVVTVCLACPAVDRVLVVTRDPGVRARAAALGALPVDEPVPPVSAGDEALNGALEAGRRAATRLGARALAVVVADLPRLAPADVTALFAALAGGASVALAPSRDGGGLGALALEPVDALPFRFGGGTALARTLAAAEAGGLTVAHVVRDGLACDVDTPADLGWLEPDGARP